MFNRREAQFEIIFLASVLFEKVQYITFFFVVHTTLYDALAIHPLQTALQCADICVPLLQRYLWYCDVLSTSFGCVYFHMCDAVSTRLGCLHERTRRMGYGLVSLGLSLPPSLPPLPLISFSLLLSLPPSLPPSLPLFPPPPPSLFLLSPSPFI